MDIVLSTRHAYLILLRTFPALWTAQDYVILVPMLYDDGESKKGLSVRDLLLSI